MPKVRIKLNSTDVTMLNTICDSIKGLAKKSGIDISGPVPLPTKKLKLTTLTSPDGEGTQRWEKWEKRIHKRLIDVTLDERVMRQIMRLRVPESVHIEIQIME